MSPPDPAPRTHPPTPHTALLVPVGPSTFQVSGLHDGLAEHARLGQRLLHLCQLRASAARQPPVSRVRGEGCHEVRGAARRGAVRRRAQAQGRTHARTHAPLRVRARARARVRVRVRVRVLHRDRSA